jgi:hypothetical protein
VAPSPAEPADRKETEGSLPRSISDPSPGKAHPYVTMRGKIRDVARRDRLGLEGLDVPTPPPVAIRSSGLGRRGNSP